MTTWIYYCSICGADVRRIGDGEEKRVEHPDGAGHDLADCVFRLKTRIDELERTLAARPA